jgi:translocation and assembly module TamB
VRVEGREEEQDEALRLTGDVLVKLGKNVHVQAFGLDTRLRGNLRVIRAEQREPRAEGELDLVEGFFEIYGQRLEIERGTMIFNGPLDDPTISVRAVREIDELSADKITVGIELSGRAQNLTSNVYSNPSMSEAEALSYLMFGRPLAGTSAEDGSALSSTAYALGLRQAGLITNQIGQVVGLDELEVTGRNQNTTELVAGKQINTRLYARYAYGVFSKLGRLLLRYRLSEALAIEVGVGESQSMDILYTIETD